MKRSLVAGLAVVCATALAWAGLRPERRAAAPAANELTPSSKLWAADATGLQVQIAVPVRRIHTTESRLPVVVWFRNNTDKPATLKSISPAFASHGALTVTDEGGKKVIVGECLKKHAMEELTVGPGEQRGFLCDAFHQPCYRRPAGELKPGKYVVRFRNSNKVTVEVVK